MTQNLKKSCKIWREGGGYFEFKIYNILLNYIKEIKDNKINRCRSLIYFKKKSSMTFRNGMTAELCEAGNGMEKGHLSLCF